MKVLNARSALLSDYEVLRLLQEMDEEQHQSAASIELAEDDDHAMQAHRDAKVEEALKKVPDNLRTVQYETLSILTHPTRSCAFQAPEHIQGLHEALKRTGFIGGRRGLDAVNGGGQPSPGRKRKPARKTGGRQPKRSKSDGETGDNMQVEEDFDDPAMVSPTLEPNQLSDTADGGDLLERGPDEILPDRALTKAERLQIVNHAPRSPVELHVLVEELGMRFTEAQIYELLAIIQRWLPIPAAEDEAEMMQPEGEGGIEGDHAADDAAAGEDHSSELFRGGADETTFVAGDEEDDDDAWANEAVGGGGDDLEGGGANDDDET